MGEYAKYKGEEIKIGTCEDLYYLRADQVRLLDPDDAVKVAMDHDYRFRFPFPTEDSIEPGEFDNHDYGVALHVPAPSEGVSHDKVQFVASAYGFNVMLPCPLSAEGEASGLNFHKNGFPGEVRIVQQRMWEGKLVLVLSCGGCRAKWRAPSLEDAAPYIEACADRAERALKELPEPDNTTAKYWITMGQRIREGYTDPLPIPFI